MAMPDAEQSPQSSNAKRGRREQGKPVATLTAAAAAAASATATVTLPRASGAMAAGGQPQRDQPFVRVQQGEWMQVGDGRQQ